MPILKQSRFTYAETLTRLQAAIANGGNTVFATIDQAAAAQTAGLSLRPTTLVIFGNPKGGTPLMEADPLVALDLPLKLLVWEEGGSVSFAYVPPSEVAARYRLAGHEGLVAAMERALAALSDAVAAP